MATKNKVLLSFLFIFIFALLITPQRNYVLSADSTPTPPPTLNVCNDHGGVNCSILNPDASVVCNDGTVIQSFIIYAVPQCQKTIADTNQQQSRFMEESGCYPPGEMACISNQSYKNMSNTLASKGLLNSELGKQDLIRCRQEINDYTWKEKDYRECLVKNNNPNFDLHSNRLVLPLMKVVFCPIFYGDRSSYNETTDACQCDDGYFMYNDSCTEASLICQAKYGPKAYAKNGNCFLPQITPSLKPLLFKTPVATKMPTPSISPTPSPITSTIIYPSQPLFSLSPNEPASVRKAELNIFKVIFNLFKTIIH